MNAVKKQAPAAEKLSALLRFPTVAGTADFQEDQAAFAGCREAIHALFPGVAGACERHLIAGRGLVYHWRGKAQDKPWVMMAHYDVVPAPDEGWERPPFSGDIAEGFVHGRGAVDTKGTLAAMLEAAEGLIGEGFVPEQDIYFCFSGDEETYGPTTPAIIQWLKDNKALPFMVLDEGGQVESAVAPGFSGRAALVGVAEKGMAQIRLSVTGPGGHASRPPKESQAIILAQALARLHRNLFPWRIDSPVKEALKTISSQSAWPHRLMYRFPEIFRGFITRYARNQAGSTAALFHTTLAVTQLSGSEAANVLPITAAAGLNLRLMPGESLEEAAAHVQKALGDPRVKVELIAGNTASSLSEMEGPAFSRMRQAVETTWPGALTLPALMIGATDAYHYSAICPRVYRFSPLKISSDIAATVHAANERLPVEALEEAVSFYRALIVG